MASKRNDLPPAHKVHQLLGVCIAVCNAVGLLASLSGSLIDAQRINSWCITRPAPLPKQAVGVRGCSCRTPTSQVHICMFAPRSLCMQCLDIGPHLFPTSSSSPSAIYYVVPFVAAVAKSDFVELHRTSFV